MIYTYIYYVCYIYYVFLFYITATTGPTRTWEQVKVIYKNILKKGSSLPLTLFCSLLNTQWNNVCLFITATKKKAKQKKPGGVPASLRHTPAEEQALGLNANRPIVEGKPGGSSSLDPQPGFSRKSTFIIEKWAYYCVFEQCKILAYFPYLNVTMFSFYCQVYCYDIVFLLKCSIA